MSKLTVIDREGGAHQLQGDTDVSVMENIRDNDLPILASCGGSCACATCHVYVDPAWAGKLAAPSLDELDLVSQSSYYREGQSRLSCQIQFSAALDGLTVTLAPEE
ncbi:MAG TPA: 2Fe-2S iron-sulfur cluster-binding protein [Azospirillaceae bacterium]|nr:2Fe-2S iron-sulfur cluster-binding protein [Azospirillaceae bacterium]